MGQTLDIGRRIELVPMDPHFHDISIALYCQQGDEGPAFLVHTYSHREGAGQRIEFVVRAMQILGGMDLTPDGLLRFPCRAEHTLACRRVFLEACKLASDSQVEPRPLFILDKRSNRNITLSSLGGGVYHLTADGAEEGKGERIETIAGGLIKLGQMPAVEQRSDRVAFSCGHAHDAMVGLLLVRALNVQAILREQEMVASRGILAAPSQQR